MIDIIVIGAGVSGCAIARELSRKKADVLVLERAEDVCCGTTKANSAIVHAGYDATHGSLMAKLNVQGSVMMEQLSKDLDFHYKRNGSLVVMISEEDRPNLIKLYENGVKNGVEGLRIIERDELVAMEPNISVNAVAALYAPTGGIVCPFGLNFALAENAAANGVKFQFDSEVTGVEKIEGGWKVKTVKGDLEARANISGWADAAKNLAEGLCATEFCGYEKTTCKAKVLAILAEEEEFELLDTGRDGNTHYDYYCLLAPVPIEEIVLLPGETDAAQWVSFAQVHQMIEEKKICRIIARQFRRQEQMLRDRQK